MSDDAIQELLTTSTTVQVATLNQDGSPHLVPMFFILRHGQITFWTYRTSQKAVNLHRDSRIACLVETGQRTEEVRGVQINGVAAISDDPGLVREVGIHLHERYVGLVAGEAGAGIERNGQKRVVVTVDPLSVVTWDHRKLSR